LLRRLRKTAPISLLFPPPKVGWFPEQKSMKFFRQTRQKAASGGDSKAAFFFIENFRNYLF
ncbi:MAG: hypothetical protein ACOVSW_00010, partial [Candidatus Kapaibacteriota bacterium]